MFLKSLRVCIISKSNYQYYYNIRCLNINRPDDGVYQKPGRLKRKDLELTATLLHIKFHLFIQQTAPYSSDQDMYVLFLLLSLWYISVLVLVKEQSVLVILLNRST